MSEEFCEKQVKHLLHNLEPLRKQLAEYVFWSNLNDHDDEYDFKGMLSSSTVDSAQAHPSLHFRLKNLPTDLAENRAELQTSITGLEKAIKLVKRNLPAQSGFYLYLVLGSMNVNMRSNKLKLNYKIEYEK